MSVTLLYTTCKNLLHNLSIASLRKLTENKLRNLEAISIAAMLMRPDMVAWLVFSGKCFMRAASAKDAASTGLFLCLL